MPTYEEIQKQIAAIEGGNRFLPRKEIRELPSVLAADERVEQLTAGFYNGGLGLLVATNRRLIFVDKGMLYGLRVEDFHYDRISSIQYKTGLLLGEITIFSSGNRAEIGQVEKSMVRQFGEYVRAKIGNPTPRQPAPPVSGAAPGAQNAPNTPGTAPPPPWPAAPAAPGADDAIISKLERLAALKAQGILTEQEFLDQKARILRG
ncbi:MAG: PH domain-containing protein [Lysobacter sp.]|nr:PH domain-containing protein [Lysobacter sp.]